MPLLSKDFLQIHVNLSVLDPIVVVAAHRSGRRELRRGPGLTARTPGGLPGHGLGLPEGGHPRTPLYAAAPGGRLSNGCSIPGSRQPLPPAAAAASTPGPGQARHDRWA